MNNNGKFKVIMASLLSGALTLSSIGVLTIYTDSKMNEDAITNITSTEFETVNDKMLTEEDLEEIAKEEAEKAAAEQAAREAAEQAEREAAEQAARAAAEQAEREAAEQAARAAAEQASEEFNNETVVEPVEIVPAEPEYYPELDGLVIPCGETMFYNDLCRTLHEMPEGLKECMIKNNLKIYLLNDPNGVEQIQNVTDHRVAGVYKWSSETKSPVIYAEALSHPESYSNSCGMSIDEFSHIYAKNVLIHELGHFFDKHSRWGNYGYYNCSETEEFAQIHAAEVGNYCNTYHYNKINNCAYGNVSSAKEYFATAYVCYMLYPGDLMANCPRTYNYIDNAMRKINDDYLQKKNEEQNGYQLTR